MQLLKWLLGDWRLWLVAGLCVTVLYWLASAVPVSYQKICHDPADSPAVVGHWDINCDLGGAFVLFYGVRTGTVHALSAWPIEGQPGKYKKVGRWTLTNVANLPIGAAVVVMALCGLLALIWIKKAAVAWLWMTRLAVLCALTYPLVASDLTKSLMPHPSQPQFLVDVSWDLNYTVVRFLAAAVIAGGLTFVFRWAFRLMKAPMQTGVRRVHAHVTSPGFQQVVHQTAVDAAAAGVRLGGQAMNIAQTTGQTIGGFMQEVRDARQPTTPQQGHVRCPACNNLVPKGAHCLDCGAKLPD